MSVAHQCAAAGCSAQVSPGVLLCWSHWRMLQGVTQRQIKSAWRAYRAGEPGSRVTYMLTCARVVVMLAGSQHADDPRLIRAHKTIATYSDTGRASRM